MSLATISQKIKNSFQLLIEMHNISEAELCRATKISQPTLWRLLNGESTPRVATLNTIAAYFNISVDQLIGNQPIAPPNASSTASQLTSLFLPIFALENPSEIKKMLGKTSTSNWRYWLEVEPSINKKCFSVKVLGESMWPNFIEDTFVIIDPDIDPKHKHFVLCHLHKTDEIVFRQYVEDKTDRFLKSINPIYKTIAIQKKDKVYGVAIQSKNLMHK